MSRAPSKAPSKTPSRAPSQAPSRASSGAPSQSPSLLAETSAPPRPTNSKAPFMTTIAEGASSIDPSPSPSTVVPASRGLHLKTSAPTAAYDATSPSHAPSHAPSRAPTSSSSRAPRGTHVPSLAPSVSASRAPSSAAAIARSRDPHTSIAATSRWVDSGSASGHTRVPTLSDAPSAAPTHRSTRSIVPTAMLDAEDITLPMTIAPAGSTTFPKSARTTTDRDSSRAPDMDEGAAGRTMIPTASGVAVSSKWTSKADLAAATRQVNYAQLGEEERTMQEEWAQQKVAEFAPCPRGFAWRRHETCYQCFGGQHFMSDLTLAEGEPALYSQGKRSPYIDQYTPDWSKGQIPPGFYGPFKPLGWDHQEKKWRYPEGC
ncbi:hypothetical protein PG993_009331 [Apiospora rasikravindrae]|uniref:Uncharacterized protein n=1 Tax=Apiospora rasikravindrae TaxID=990691 RepID=A0ABR1SJ32_9PEZI